MAPRILIVDDERELRVAFRRMLERERFETELAATGLEALEILRQSTFDLLLTDLSMPDLDGLSLLAELRERNDQTPAVVVSGVSTVGQAMRAVRLGALDVVEKPIAPDRLLFTVHRALRESILPDVATDSKPEAGVSTELLGETSAMRRLKRLISRVAPSAGRVIITGENGTGKELVAAAIHAGSPRREGPFITLNCGAVPENLVESELFGHEKGAFTGATNARKGRFELAHGGTLFLDEIGDMPMPMQVKLLRVLQEGQFERVGGNKTLAVDVRVLAATHRDLERMVDQGLFREDLYYRLNVVSLYVPPLRERREDIPALIQHFAPDYLKFTEQALQALQHYCYPGNVRELQNIVERLDILYGAGVLDRREIEEVVPLTQNKAPDAHHLYHYGESLRTLAKQAEKRIILEAIAAHGNSKTAAAQALQTERSHFYKKCRQLGITGEDT